MVLEIAISQKSVNVSANYKTVQILGSGVIESIINGATDLGYTDSPTQGIITSSTGTDATIPLVDTNAGLMSPTQKNKLDGVATGATANASDAQLRDRTTHTGVQAIATVTGLQTALDGKQATISNSDSITQGSTNLFLTTEERTKLTNTSGTNTGDNAVNSLYSGLASQSIVNALIFG